MTRNCLNHAPIGAAYVVGDRTFPARTPRCILADALQDELDRVLGLLARRRSERLPAPVAVRAVGLVLRDGAAPSAEFPVGGSD